LNSWSGSRAQKSGARATERYQVRLCESESAVAAQRPAACAIGILCLLLSACATQPSYPAAAPSTGKRPPPTERGFRTSDLAKADVDVVAETHVSECLASARLVMEKLYRRNPREWHKSKFASMDAAMAHAFDPKFEFRFAELGGVRGTDAIVLALKPEYSGDRVFAFAVGLSSMVLMAYDGKTEFYLTDTLDAQKLYNSARNIEIAAWKLANSRDAHGALLIVSNEATGVPNLSFERELGKMIAYQDMMAQITAQRTNRTIRRVVQTLATAVFLPI